MATTERNSKGTFFTGSAGIAAEIASLRTSVASDSLIYASDINRIATLINNLNGHYHTYDDAYQLPTYGNTGDRNEYWVYDKSTSGPLEVVANAPVDTASNTTITAARHNALANALNDLRSHYHTIDDRTAI
jgi:hypothetical protein